MDSELIKIVLGFISALVIAGSGVIAGWRLTSAKKESEKANTIHTLTETVDDLIATVQTLRKEVSALHLDNASLSGKVDVLQKKSNADDAEKVKQAAEILILKKENTTLKSKVTVLELSERKLQTRVEELESAATQERSK